MYSGVDSLTALNAKRKELIASGAPIAEVNAAYNNARKKLMDSTPTFRRPPKFTGVGREPINYSAYSLVPNKVPANELHITDKEVFI